MSIYLGYIRKSVLPDPTASSSPARQRAAIERAAGGSPVEWFEDLDISGRYEADRPGWQALLARLNGPEVAGVIVESFDRSHRNVREFLAFYDDRLVPANKTLISASQNINLATADGRAMASVLMAFSEMESRKTSERMTRAIYHLVTAEGRYYGPLPFGCARDEAGRLTPSAGWYWLDPATGQAAAGTVEAGPAVEQRYYHDALRAVFELYAQGKYSYHDVAMGLNSAGWRMWDTDHASPILFTRMTVRSIIRRWQVYAGDMPPSPTTPKKINRERPTLTETHPPILPVELCRLVGQVFASRSEVRRPGQCPKTGLPLFE